MRCSGLMPSSWIGIRAHEDGVRCCDATSLHVLDTTGVNLHARKGDHFSFHGPDRHVVSLAQRIVHLHDPWPHHRRSMTHGGDSRVSKVDALRP